MVGRLNGKIAVVTGAGQGIGRESALLFAKEGAQVIATDMDLSKLSDMKDVAGIVKILKVNIMEKKDIENLAKEVGRVDVIFNCAGIVPGGSILQTSDDTWSLAMNLNVRGAYWVCQALLPAVLEAKSKLSIINMSSVCGSLKGVPNRFAYGVSKGALIALTKSIAADFIGQGVRANSICPGTVDTPSFRGRVNDSPDPEQAMNDFISRQKMGRLGTAEEIASLALYLASDESSYMTGQELIIDGGWCL